MLHDIAVRSTELLKKREIIVSDKERIYIYGFELIYSLLFIVGTMLVWSLFLGCTCQLILFLVCFMPIRMVAGGYHAKTYGKCFLWSNVVTIVSLLAAELLWEMDNPWIEIIMWGMFFVADIYIVRNAPVISKKVPMKENLIKRNKKITFSILVLGIIILIGIRIILSNELSYVGIIAFCIVAFMIKIVKKGGIE